MKIAIVTETYPPEINGVALSLEQLVRGLLGAGERVQLVRPRHRRETRFHQPALEQLLVGGWPLPRYRELRFGSYRPGALQRDWRREPPRVVHVATQGPLGLAAARVAMRLGIPWTAAYHTRFELYGAYYGLGRLDAAVGRYLRWFHNRAAGTFVPTRRLAEELRQRGFERLEVMPRGVDTELFAPERRSRALRRSWGVAGDGPVILYVGRLAPEKNVDLAIEAFRRIQRHRPRARMIVVGSGPESRRLRSLHRDLVFTGNLRDLELAAAYASADLFVFPSVTETYGNVVAEAMASGLPVLAMADAAAAELISCGDNGITVAVGDEAAFARLAGNLGRLPLAVWRNLGRSARLRLEGASWDAAARAFARQLAGVAGRVELEHAA